MGNNVMIMVVVVGSVHKFFVKNMVYGHRGLC